MKSTHLSINNQVILKIYYCCLDDGNTLIQIVLLNTNLSTVEILESHTIDCFACPQDDAGQVIQLNDDCLKLLTSSFFTFGIKHHHHDVH